MKRMLLICTYPSAMTVDGGFQLVPYGKDIYQDIAYPVTRQFRQELYDEIVKEFNMVMKNEK